MKKILFATTALVATAGVAAADVTFGGYARYGVLYNDLGPDGIAGTADDAGDTNITSRFRLQIDATAESDSGVEFGARVRIQQTNGGSGQGINGARFFVRSGGLEVGVGNIQGALEWMPGQYPIDIGLTGHTYEYSAYNVGTADQYDSAGAGASQRNGMEVKYSVGDFGAHLSFSEADGVVTDSNRTAVHVSYAFSGWTVALGYQDSSNTLSDDTEWTATVGGNIGPAFVNLSHAETHGGVSRTVLAGRFDVGAATNVEAYIVDQDAAANTGFGIDFNHDLGGGTSLRGGVSKSVGGGTFADFGVRFNF